jgi:hypothetical protein
MPFDPWKGLTAAQMMEMQTNDPDEFARRAATLEQAKPNAKGTVVYINGFPVSDVPKAND